MSVSRGDGSVSSSRRGQSTLMGIVLLLGMVAAGSLGIFLIAGDAISSAEQQSEQERVELAFIDLSHSISTTSTNTDTTRSVEFEAGDRGAITKSNSGTIDIYANNEQLTDSINMSAIEYRGNDGSIIAYQAGAVWREKGDETRMLSQPTINYDSESKTLSLPVTSFDGDQELSSGEVTITHTKTRPIAETSYVENSTVTLVIESEYYQGWRQYFEDEVGSNSIQGSGQIEGDLGYVEVELGLEELEGVFSSGIVVSDSFETQGADRDDYSFEELDGEAFSPSPIDDEIEEHVNKTNTSENQTAIADETLTAGTYFTESIDLGNHEKLTANLEDGDVTLVVDGDIDVEGEISVTNWENESGSDHSFNIYSNGNLDISGGELCVGTCPSSNGNNGNGNNNDQGTENLDASALQIYGNSSMSVGFDGGIFEGVLFAPSDDFDGPNEVLSGTGHCDDQQVCLHSNPEFYGSLFASTVHAHANANEVIHDPQVEKIDPEIHPDGWVTPPDITYLNVAVHELSIENT